MAFWDARRRGARPADLTWMPDELELAPDWVREEILSAPKELQEWLHTQYPAAAMTDRAKRTRGGRRGKRPRM